ncbi:SDR family NAD(P)-dependent oxidoreductase [Kiritimatiellaeota bacterium B1221]|nr:SDR family NAD(P)-dependent oxidoreductase [Kiritimatiellaeota bacterium B1221]
MNSTKNILITGTSSGIGLATALEMKNRGWRVFASARKPEDLSKLQALGFEVLDMDLANQESVIAGAQKVLASCPDGLHGLVNNAGYGQPGALEDLDVESMRQQFSVNVIGLQQLTNLILPGMIERRSGRIVHVSSVVGRVALPFMGIYSASKFAVEALADAQRVELSGTGVQISLVEPGPVTTSFSKNAVQSSVGSLPKDQSRFSTLYQKELSKREKTRESKPFALPPEAVAKKIAHALTSAHPRRRYKVTFPAYLGAVLSRLAPDALIDFILTKELKNRLSD